MIILSFVLLNGGMGILAFASTLPMVFVAQALMGLATSIGYPTLMGMSIEYVDDAERATAMGLHQSVYAIGMFAGPWLSGILADAVGLQSMFGVVGIAGLVIGILGASQLAHKARSAE
jgi:MFS family permease